MNSFTRSQQDQPLHPDKPAVLGAEASHLNESVSALS